MKLRSKLFITVSITILATFVLALFLTAFVVERGTKRAQEKIRVLMQQPQQLPAAREDIILILNQMRQDFAKDIGYHLSVAFALGLIVMVTLSEFFLKKFTRPIEVLARATEEVERGDLGKINLKPLRRGQDEITTLYQGFNKMVEALKNREQMRSILNKVVAKPVATQILKNGVELGGEERVATILFSDVRNFTHLTEHMAPKMLLTLMNRYLTEMCRLIDGRDGIVDKFVGDEIMALWGVPLAHPHHAAAAIDTALLMLKKLEIVNGQQRQKKAAEVEVGIGIHTGNVVAGNVGSENRLNYTVLGANVNLASRLCSQAKGMQLLISEATLNEPLVKERFCYNALAPIILKGFEKPVEIFEISGIKKD